MMRLLDVQMSPDPGPGSSHSTRVAVSSGQTPCQHLAILGYPGSGKTTLLKQLTLALTKSRKTKQARRLTHQVPIMLFLRDHVKAITTQPALTLVDVICADLSKWGLTIPAAWFEQQLRRGRCLIMLDGLDEVPDPSVRQGVVAWIEQQMVLYGPNRFVVTSRPFGYRSNPLQHMTVLEVCPFTMPQIEDFIFRWYAATEHMSRQHQDPGVQMIAQEGASDLLTRLRQTPALMALAVNPLLLTMLVTVHRYSGSLPGRRVELYGEICKVFLGRRQEALGIPQELTPEQKQVVLQPLAYHLMRAQAREMARSEIEPILTEALAMVSPQLPADAFLRLVENTSGLLLEREHGIYSFAHLTFQEYLAAVHVREQHLEGELIQFIGESWWHETIRLYCAQADATAVIENCLAGGAPSVAALTLAVECLQEAQQVHPQARARLEQILAQGVEDEDPERRRVVAEALLTLRIRRMEPIRDRVFRDTGLLSCAEYQLFLNELAGQGPNRKPTHWREQHFGHGTGRRPVLGVQPEDAQAFCTWLTLRHAPYWRFRLPVADEVMMPELKTGFWVLPGQQLVGDDPRQGLVYQLQGWAVRLVPSDGVQRHAVADLARVPHAKTTAAGLLDQTVPAAANQTFIKALDFVLDCARRIQSDMRGSGRQYYQTAPFFVQACARLHSRISDHVSRRLTILFLTRDLASSFLDDLTFAQHSYRPQGSDLAHAVRHMQDMHTALQELYSGHSGNSHFPARQDANSRAHALEAALSLVQELTSILNHLRARNDLLSHLYRRATILALVLGGEEAQERLRSRSNWSEGQEDLLRWNIRLSLWLSAVLLQEELNPDAEARTQETGGLQELSQALLDHYVAWAAIEERLAGRLPAVEGILLIKEELDELPDKNETAIAPVVTTQKLKLPQRPHST